MLKNVVNNSAYVKNIKSMFYHVILSYLDTMLQSSKKKKSRKLSGLLAQGAIIFTNLPKHVIKVNFQVLFEKKSLLLYKDNNQGKTVT